MNTMKTTVSGTVVDKIEKKRLISTSDVKIEVEIPHLAKGIIIDISTDGIVEVRDASGNLIVPPIMACPE